MNAVEASGVLKIPEAFLYRSIWRGSHYIFGMVNVFMISCYQGVKEGIRG